MLWVLLWVRIDSRWIRQLYQTGDGGHGVRRQMLQCIALAVGARPTQRGARNSGKPRGRTGSSKFKDVAPIPRASEKFVGSARASSAASVNPESALDRGRAAQVLEQKCTWNRGQRQRRHDHDRAGDADEVAEEPRSGRRNGGRANRDRVEHAEQMCAPLWRSIVRHRAVNHGGEGIEPKTDERKYEQCKLHRQQQDHDYSYCGEGLANGDSGAIAEPIADPSAGELTRGAADKH